MLIRFRDGNNFPGPFDAFDDLFGRDFTSFFGRDLSEFFHRNPGMAMPAVNIQENENNFQIELAAPGLRKEDFKINVEHNMLTISAEQESRREEAPNQPQNQQAGNVSAGKKRGQEETSSGEAQSVAQAQPSTAMQAQGKQQMQRYTRREFSYSSFQRSFTLPETVDAEKISANYQNGILTVVVPKREKQQTRLSRNIEIS